MIGVVLFLVDCLVLAAVGVVVADVCVTLWYERVYLPRIAGQE